MKYFLMSDIHIDFWLDLWKDQEWGFRNTVRNLKKADSNYDDTLGTKSYEACVPSFEKFFDMNMLPADALLSAGDFANDQYIMVNFLRWASTKYSKVYVTFGNHDLGVNGSTFFGNGNPAHSSEDRMSNTVAELSNCPNVIFLEGKCQDGIAGCMGMCDFSVRGWLDDTMADTVKRWQHQWYDGRVWRYMNTLPSGKYGKMNPRKIWSYYSDMMNNVLQEHPKIMMTHFCPIELGIQREYEGSSSNPFFYFTGKKFLDQMDDGSYWICGHIHGMLSTDYTNKDGHVIHIRSMPSGYPGENPYEAQVGMIWKKQDRLLEV